MTSGGQGNKCESKLSHSRKETVERIPTHSARRRGLWGKKWPISREDAYITCTFSMTYLRIPVLGHLFRASWVQSVLQRALNNKIWGYRILISIRFPGWFVSRAVFDCGQLHWVTVLSCPWADWHRKHSSAFICHVRTLQKKCCVRWILFIYWLSDDWMIDWLTGYTYFSKPLFFFIVEQGYTNFLKI